MDAGDDGGHEEGENEKQEREVKGLKTEDWTLRGEVFEHLCLARVLSVAFLHLDPGVRVGLGGGGVFEGVGERLLAGGAGIGRVLRLSRVRRSLLYGRGG